MCNDRCRECRNGYRFFEIITPYTDGHINGSYYQELNGADAQNVIYQATASAPLDVAPPVAMCRNVTVHLNNTGNGNTTVALVNNGSTDICGIQSNQFHLRKYWCQYRDTHCYRYLQQFKYLYRYCYGHRWCIAGSRLSKCNRKP